ncbi:hypothetical protein CMI47_21525 [Candidatus Pacearchaeota archaeon]|jgi:hypothetical protein|nr:hypothetical protein [Candidatus Pacearchaeota archaeon]|tara:strand:+ start:3364 stop:3687 length:324 start_codon:yes stop_codon:yes gene_type:complete
MKKGKKSKKGKKPRGTKKQQKKQINAPTLTPTRAVYVGNGVYKSKHYNPGQTNRDGKKFTKHKKCFGCKKRLTRKEYDQLGYRRRIKRSFIFTKRSKKCNMGYERIC